MITLSLITLGSFLIKLALLGFLVLIGAVVFLWPINDKPVSKTQQTLFYVYSFIMTIVIFGVIKFTV